MKYLADPDFDHIQLYPKGALIGRDVLNRNSAIKIGQNHSTVPKIHGNGRNRTFLKHRSSPVTPQSFKLNSRFINKTKQAKDHEKMDKFYSLDIHKASKNNGGCGCFLRYGKIWLCHFRPAKWFF